MSKYLCILTLFVCSTAQAQWEQSMPIREAAYDSVLREIEERMPIQHGYRSTDKMTHVHETTHGLNSRLRQRHTGMNCAYIVRLGGLFILLPEPNITLKQIADNIPEDMRGATYRLYLEQQRKYWNKQPLYVLDEFASYYNCTVYGLETKVKDHARINGSILHTLQFLYYAIELVEIIPGDYEQKEHLHEVVDTLGELTQASIVRPAIAAGLWTKEHKVVWNMCVDKWNKHMEIQR